MSTTPTLRDAAGEAAEILRDLIANIERKGMYSQESTLGFIGSAHALLAAALTQGAGEAVEPVAQPQIGWAILDRNERYMLFPMNCEAEACSYCEDGAQPVPVLADKAVLDQHEKDQGL